MKKNYNAPFMAVIPMMPFVAVMAGSGNNGIGNGGYTSDITGGNPELPVPGE